MSGQISLVDDGAEARERTYRAHDADFTPTPVARQLMTFLRDTMDFTPERHLDPCSGAGVFSMVAREVFPHVSSVAIEVRPEEREHVKRNADVGMVGDALALLDAPRGFSRSFGLVASNPAFSLLPELLPRVLRHTRRLGLVAFLGLNSLSQRGKESCKLFQRYPPRWQLRILGPIDFRGGQINPKSGKPYGADPRSYSYWIWRADGEGGSISMRHHLGGWRTIDLPWLPSSDRKWRGTRPGTETA